MADIPNILMVFSNPKEDLNGVREELRDVTKMLEYTKWDRQGTFDYHPHNDKSLMEVINETSAKKNYKASFFHFSGHANEQALLFPRGAASITAICSVLRKIKTRVVFLNGCCTRGLLEALFKEGEVVAAIATYSKVGDKLACELSRNFYNSFIDENISLYDAFINIRNGYQQYVLHDKGFDMSKERDLISPNAGFPDEQKDGFQWGLFFKDDSFRDITIGNILKKGTSSLEENERELKEKENQLVVEEEKRKAKEKYKKDKVLVDDYNKQAELVETLKTEIQKLKNKQISLRQELIEKDAIAKQIKISDDFRNAIKNINYTDQQEVYGKANDCEFGCYAVVGDGDTLIDLLLMRMKDEYGFESNNHISREVHFNSVVAKGFWQALAYEIGAKNGETPEQVVDHLINELFFEIDRSITKQHIFLKVYITEVPDLKSVTKLVSDFWTTLQKVCPCTGSKAQSLNIKHKIIMILIDQKGNPMRLAELEKFINEFNEKLETKMDPMPWVRSLEKQEIESWITMYNLRRVGIDKTMAGDIYTKSKNGKIRQVLMAIQDKCNMKDLDLFHQLKIIPDDAQTLLGKK